MLAGGVDASRSCFLLALLRVEIGAFEQDLAVADHRVERRAQLVAHLGEEDRFGVVRRIGHFLGLAQAHGRRR